jgi:hypothetical protein
MPYYRRTSISDGCSWVGSALFWLLWWGVWVYVIGAGVYSCVARNVQQADIVTIKITNTGFEPHSVTLSGNQRLHIVNASSHPVVICIGRQQICSTTKVTPTAKTTPTAVVTPIARAKAMPTTVATPIAVAKATPTTVAMPTRELTISPGKSYDLSFKHSNYGFTIMPQMGVVFVYTDLGVTMRGGDNSAVNSGGDNSSVGDDAGGSSSGVSISSGDDDNNSVSSSSDDEEDSGSSSSSGSSAGDDSSGSDDGGGSSSGGGDDGD